LKKFADDRSREWVATCKSFPNALQSMINVPESQLYLQPLVKYLEQFHPVSKELITHYEKNCRLVTVKKNKFILSPFDNNNAMFFLLKGVVRGFIKEDKKDISTWFGFENQFLEAVRNPAQQSNYSVEYIQAIEDCTLIEIPQKLTSSLYTACPEANIISRKLLSMHYYAATERSTLARIPTALSRYLKLEKTGMDISRIPQRYLASYLGIRFETLSRLRNRHLEKESLKTA